MARLLWILALAAFTIFGSIHVSLNGGIIVLPTSLASFLLGLMMMYEYHLSEMELLTVKGGKK